jgi:hypothetical protein
MGRLVSFLVEVVPAGTPQWLVQLTQELFTWTFPSQGTELERASTWRSEFFFFLGVLCCALPDARFVLSFVDAICSQPDEEFNEATSSFLRGYDAASVSSNVPKPQDLGAVRRVFARRIKQTRNYDRLSSEKGFTSESHAADALTVMFFGRHRLSGGGVSIPSDWSGLAAVFPVLADLTADAASSGYIAALFLAVADSSHDVTMLADISRVANAWVRTYGDDTHFWVSNGVGNRLCSWLASCLDGAKAAALSPALKAELSSTLDTLVRAGVAAARMVEARL